MSGGRMARLLARLFAALRGAARRRYAIAARSASGSSLKKASALLQLLQSRPRTAPVK